MRTARVALALACAVAPSAALAQDPPPPESAEVMDGRALFVLGTTLAQQGQWPEALEAFQRSSALRTHPVTTYNLGFCHRALGHSTRARRFFAKALEQHEAKSEGALSEDLERSARAYIVEIDAKLARVSVTLASAEAAISIDGRPLEVVSTGATDLTLVAGTREVGKPERPPAARFVLLVDPGAHVFVLTLPGRPDAITNHTFQAGTAPELRLAVAAAEPVQRPPPIAVPAGPP